MAHEAYSPVGYIYRADQYCLDCIPKVAAGGISTGSSQAQGYKRGDCNCTEHRLDRMAAARNIDRYDERSYDSGDFPKSIAYHNDLHCECGPEHYGYGPEDPEWEQQYCGATCGKCHDVIDGYSHIDGPDTCPAFENRELTV